MEISNEFKFVQTFNKTLTLNLIAFNQQSDVPPESQARQAMFGEESVHVVATSQRADYSHHLRSLQQGCVGRHLAG